MSQGQWVFLNVSDPSQIRETSNRSLIRSVAAVDHSRKYRRSQDLRFSIQRRTTGESEVRETHNGVGLILPSSVTSASFVPDWIVGTHIWCAADAMATFNLSPRDYTYYSDVLNHYLTSIVPVWSDLDEKGPLPFVVEQMQACMGSTLLLEAVALFSSTHQDSLYQRTLSSRTKNHHQKVIRLINQNLDRAIVDDVTILAVAMMGITSATLASDSIQGTVESLKEVEIHMDGIETMVQLRGGIYNLGMNGAVNMVVVWQDQITAQLTGKPSRFAPRDAEPTPEVDVPQFMTIFTSPIPWNIFLLSPQVGQPNKTVKIIYVLFELALLRKTQPDAETTAEKTSTFEAKLSSMENIISSYISGAASAASVDYNDLVREACCVTGSICATLMFRDTAPENPDLMVLKNRLAHIFNNLDTTGIEKQRFDIEAPFLLWILFTGGILCRDIVERSFFAHHIQGLVLYLQIGTWEQVDNILRGYLWGDEFCNPACWKLWEVVKNSLP